VKLEAALAQLNRAITVDSAPAHHRRAEVLFRLGRFEESVRDYDTSAVSGRPHNDDSCWERGLAQYYAGDYDAGRDQFTRYHRVGSLDIENGLWRFLCIAEVEGVEKARETMYDYPRKLRMPFPALLALYMDEGKPADVLKAAQGEDLTAAERTERLFYAHYYLGKFYELVKNDEEALAHFQKALEHEIPHFMYYCAQADTGRLISRQEGPETPKD
jgi:lipoprotein NlpI